MELFESVNCDVCSSKDHSVVFKTSYANYVKIRKDLPHIKNAFKMDKELYDHEFNVVKCNNCGLIFVNPRIKEEHLPEIYQKDYSDSYRDTESELSKKRDKEFEVEIKSLMNFVDFSKPLKVLDFGCGCGFFLAKFPENFKKYGCEINEKDAEYGNKNFNVNIKTKLDFEEGYFDLIVMRHTIEHLYHPKQMVLELGKLLKKGGVFFMNAPNSNSLCFKLYGKDFRLCDPIHHIFYFSEVTFMKLLEQAGFKVLDYHYHYFDTPYFSKEDYNKILSKIAGGEEGEASPPFYGNLMEVFAKKI